jgi:hypothetical protein
MYVTKLKAIREAMSLLHIYAYSWSAILQQTMIFQSSSWNPQESSFRAIDSNSQYRCSCSLSHSSLVPCPSDHSSSSERASKTPDAQNIRRMIILKSTSSYTTDHDHRISLGDFILMFLSGGQECRTSIWRLHAMQATWISQSPNPLFRIRKPSKRLPLTGCMSIA